MRRDEAFFGDAELPLIYVGRKLKDALRLEEVLTAAGIDYLVEADEYRVGTLYRVKRVGAMFYVAPENVDAAKAAMIAAGFRPFIE